MKMADNFFSILLNRRAEIWIDPGKHFETGVEQAFTVGVEGDARNWHYIRLAEEYLERAVHNPESLPANSFTFLENMSPSGVEIVTHAPALAGGSVGVWSTNIPMLPPNVFEAGARAKDLHSADVTRRSAMGEVDAHRYIQYPFSSVGDGLSSTIFRSPSGCQEGQWVSFDFLEEKTVSTFTVEWIVDRDFAQEVQQLSYMVLGRDQVWINAVVHSCEELANDSSSINSNVTLLIRLGLGSAKTFTEVRAVVGPGPRERLPWGVVACIVGSSRAK